ncbi:MAG: DUF481 domain-containing protein, partial [Verrucomicrobiae bacterium]|nr:DUF481 domain-containing protein [Verrucomicrobiae bacterium]
MYPWAEGIEVFLKNGDRLQGELIVESDEHLTIAHPILGEIEIAKSDLAELPPIPEGPATAVVTQAKPKPEPEPAVAAAEERDMPQEKGDKRVTQIPEVLSKLPAGLVQVLQEMNSKVGFSFSDSKSRKDRTDLRFFYNSKWKNGHSEYVFDTDYRYIEVDGETSDNRYTANFRFRRQQEKNFFVQASTFYRRDPIREIDL